MTTIEGYDNAVILTQVVDGINSTDINNLKDEITSNQQLIEKSTSLLNNIGTDSESLAKLDTELQQLEQSHSSMLVSKNKLINKKTELMQEEVSINDKNTNLETWIQNHPFSMWNYTNKINKLEVYYTSFGIMGIQISYHNPDKAGEVIGNISDNTSSIETVNFPDDEWLVQIKITNSDTNTLASVLCNSISFYTSKNQPGNPPKITIPASSSNSIVSNKKFFINPKAQSWLNHKRDAEAQGATLACFETSIEINKMLSELGQDRYKYGSFYIGLYHPNALIENNNFGGGKKNNVSSNKNSNWQWVDGTPYNPNNTNWNGGEPNNWGPGENVGQMYSNGKINDLTKTNNLAAIYQKKITNTSEQTPTMSEKHISSFSIKPSLTANYDSITSPDILQKTNAESAVNSSKKVSSHIDDTLDTLDSSIKDIDEAMAKITININHIKKKKQMLNELNDLAKDYQQNTQSNPIDGFANIGQNLFSTYIPNIKEGMTDAQLQRRQNYFLNAINQSNDTIRRQTADALTAVQELEEKETENAISEFIIKKDNVFTNVLTDYMLNDGKKNKLNDVYNKIAQQNTEKERKIEINTYYDKAYKEYSNILIVIIFACIILVPIFIVNKNSMLPNNITNIMVVVIIFITTCYIIYKLIDIYMRDSKDFDKIQIPYDREAAVLEKSGEITKKKNLFSTIGRTCIGQDCCPGSISGGLVFDPLINRCVLKDTFMNYMEGGSIGGYLDETLNGYLDGLLGKSNQPGSYSLVQPFMTKSQLILASLNNSTPDSFNKLQKTSRDKIKIV